MFGRGGFPPRPPGGPMMPPPGGNRPFPPAMNMMPMQMGRGGMAPGRMPPQMGRPMMMPMGRGRGPMPQFPGGMIGGGRGRGAPPMPSAPPIPSAPPQKPMPVLPKILAEKKTDWKEHTTPTGAKFYFNSKTKISTWKKPDDLMTFEDKAAKQSSTWQICYGPDGRKYYHNKKLNSSSWETPHEIKALAQQIEQNELEEKQKIALRASRPTFKLPPEEKKKLMQETSAANKAVGNSNAASKDSSASANGSENKEKLLEKKAPKTGPVNIRIGKKEVKKEAPTPKKPTWESKEEAVKAFKQLLKDKKVSVGARWKDIMCSIIHDPRYQALKTVKERKVYLKEYQEETRIREDEERIERSKKAKIEFETLFEEYKVDHKSTFKDFASKVEKEARFLAVERERDRKNYFYDYVDDLEKKKRELDRKMKKENKAKLRKILRADSTDLDGNIPTLTLSKGPLGSEECKWMTADTTWRMAKEEGIEDLEGAKDLDKDSIIGVYENVQRDLRDEERERKAKEKERQRKLEKKLREDFRVLLDKLSLEGKIHSKMLWDAVKPLIKDEETYTQFKTLDNPKITLADTFEDFAADLDERLSSPKHYVKSAVKASFGTVQADSELEKIMESIKDDKDVKDLDEEDIKLSIFEILAKAKFKQQEKEKKWKRYRKDLKKDFLKYLDRAFENLDDLKDLSMEDAISKCSSKLTDSSAFEKLDEKKKIEIYEKARDELLKEDNMEEEEEEGKSSKKRKREDSESRSPEDDESESDDRRKRKKSSKRKSKKKKRRRREDSASD